MPVNRFDDGRARCFHCARLLGAEEEGMCGQCRKLDASMAKAATEWREHDGV